MQGDDLNIISIYPDRNRTEPQTSSSPSKIESHCNFKLTKKLGEGNFGTVRLGINLETGEEVAIKILDKLKMLQEGSEKQVERVEREISILKTLRHANIVHFYSVIQTDKSMYLIMEYIPGKELFNFIIENKRLNEIVACKFYQQIISGIDYLHKLNVVHRDLKPENLLLDERTGDLKIIDFGLSNRYDESHGNLLSSDCGSPCYAAPEMLNRERKPYYAPPVDIWSSGIILYAMICGFLPFEDENKDELYKKICDGKFIFPDFISDNAKDLINHILITDPNKRYTVEEIKSHPWFNILDIKINYSEGLLISKVVIPVDEDIVNQMVEVGFTNKEDVRSSILSNRHNDIATIYYILLRKKVRKGIKSIGDLKSSLFNKYICNKNNLYERYNYDFNLVVEDRKKGVKDKNGEVKKGSKVNGKKDKNKKKVGSTVNKLRSCSSNNMNKKRKKEENKNIEKNKDKIKKSSDIKVDNTKNNENKTKDKNKNKINNKQTTTPSMNSKFKSKLFDNNRRLTCDNKDKDKEKTLIKNYSTMNSMPKSNNKQLSSSTISKFSKTKQVFKTKSRPTKITMITSLNKKNPNSRPHSENQKTSTLSHKKNTSSNLTNKLILKSKSKKSTNITSSSFMENSQNECTLKYINQSGNQSNLNASKTNKIYKTKSKSPTNNKNSVNNSIGISKEIFYPIDLNLISFKTKVEIKENICSVLKKNKINYRNPKIFKFVIESFKNDLVFEIDIKKLNGESIKDKSEGNALFFKKIRGNINIYLKFTRKILSKIQL